MSRPEGCEPPETCFNCPFADCINAGPPTVGESAYMVIGHAPDFVDLQKIKARNKKKTISTLRAATGCCSKCGKPLTAADGDHKTCNACRKRELATERAKRVKRKGRQSK